jgi:hypothetical protein
MALRRGYLAMAFALVLGAAGCGDGSDDPASPTRTPTARIEVIVESICLHDPAGPIPTVCTFFPTRTPTPTPPSPLPTRTPRPNRR